RVDAMREHRGRGGVLSASTSVLQLWPVRAERTPHPAPPPVPASASCSKERPPKAAYATFSHKGRGESSHIGRAIHHPGHAELVGAHAKALREEGLAERHDDGAAFGERLELAF